ncbi:Sec-independent protein translocase protein TatA [Pararhizobium capsulatum DSM 1112]|uniref:Sec-independent protein translocase protein TatA n=1 Tax=Pararhizobium capsulatum DSM 1112 TaxID=1121113 RepID=A0ABU0BMX2_9HYPH|nr:hypothetical protein [Pararhizobium capsulatum]MDQ0319593.1 Sec-independent protein translocase protein TatA [Pararhizobium capsulatum DSM 1112]
MTTDLEFDPDVFGYWPAAPVYDGVCEDRWEWLADVAGQVVLDTKAQSAGSSLDELQDMLNGMTKELKQQLQQFQTLRQAANAALSENGGEIDRKVVQADAKASLEAMSLLIRTLEKIDSLQRTIAHDRRVEAEGADESLDALVAEFDTRVEQRAGELARLRWKGAGSGAADGRGDVGPDGKPPDAAEGQGGDAEGQGDGRAAQEWDGDDQRAVG